MDIHRLLSATTVWTVTFALSYINSSSRTTYLSTRVTTTNSVYLGSKAGYRFSHFGNISFVTLSGIMPFTRLDSPYYLYCRDTRTNRH